CLLRNLYFGRVLQFIAVEALDVFHHGWLPERAAEAVQSHGCVLSAEDFARHECFLTQPLKQSFFGFEVHQCPPNTHGLSVLHALKNIEKEQLEPDTPEAWLAIVQATEKALIHAQETVMDPGGNTVCTVIVDGQGLVVNLLSSIFKRFGSGIAVPGG